MSLLNSIRPGDRVTIVNRFNQRRTGRAVMRGPHGWVLNLGGAHGTPGIATHENVVNVKTPKGKAKYNPPKDRIVYERGPNVVVTQDDRYLVLRHTATYAVTDSSYPKNADGLSLAKARVDYLFKAHGSRPHFPKSNPSRKNPGWKKATISRSGSAYLVIDQHQRRRSFKTRAGAEKYAKKISGNPKRRRAHKKTRRNGGSRRLKASWLKYALLGGVAYYIIAKRGL